MQMFLHRIDQHRETQQAQNDVHYAVVQVSVNESCGAVLPIGVTMVTIRQVLAAVLVK